jgi:cobalamin biosynthesis protein CbiG
VITTATDTAGRPAIEVWAREKGLKFEDRAGVIQINAAWASGEPVAAYADPVPVGAARSLLASLQPHLDLLTEDEAEASSHQGPLLALTHRLAPHLKAALSLRPPWLALGVGCRRDAVPGVVEEGVRQALARADLATLAVGVVASVDAKKDEPALRALARSFGVPFRTFRADRLAGVPVPTPSARVQEAVGTASVSEAAAVAAAGGPLILPKVKGSVWTLAVALGPLPRH